ncbi:MAG TPA: class I SAM-dependent methyltransferase [Methanobacterium sp.]|nr:MAG: class I SAM-dependent methyltransferase [Methanobacterium sp.]HOI72136.1 class I SAM-dependent methyltransferase [Methanobacterium sp.]
MDKDLQTMDSLSITGVRAPIYPIIAEQIVDELKIREGIAIDVGAGPAALSIAMARITNLEIYAMDISTEILEIAQKSIENEGFNDRIKPILGDVHQIPFQDHFANLIFSRGSMFFWNDLTTAFKEINRVLMPGGFGFIGGGFGSAAVKKKVKKQIKHQSNRPYENSPKIQVDDLETAVKDVGIHSYTIINDESGLWVIFKK